MPILKPVSGALNRIHSDAMIMPRKSGETFIIGNDPRDGTPTDTILNIRDDRACSSCITVTEPTAPYLAEGGESITGYVVRAQNVNGTDGTMRIALHESLLVPVGGRRYPVTYIGATEVTQVIPALSGVTTYVVTLTPAYTLTAGVYYQPCAMAADAIFLGLSREGSGSAIRCSKDTSVTGGTFDPTWAHLVEVEDPYLAAIGVK